MKGLRVAFGHMEGTAARPQAVYHSVQVTGKAVLLLLWNMGAFCAALACLLGSLRKKGD